VPVNVVLQALKTILDGLVLPGDAGALEAYITPPDPRDDPPPAVYLWSSRGIETRQALPRSQTPGAITTSGWKEIEHTVDAYLTWFGESQSAGADSSFPLAVDGIMAALRTGPSPLYTSDPATGVRSDLVDIGERISYTMVPMRSMQDQRWLRYDCMFNIRVLEFFQA
jgi:hypothetical protein